MAFLNGVQQVVTYWLLHNGFSIGIGDTIPDSVTIEKVQQHIDTQKTEVDRLTQEATANKLEALPGMNIRETFENKVSKALNDARDAAGTTTQKSLNREPVLHPSKVYRACENLQGLGSELARQGVSIWQPSTSS